MDATAKTETVSVIGLGSMGTALAQAFLAHKHRVTVWNRTPSKCDVLRSAGANVAESVATAAAAGDVVVVCVLDYQVSDSLIHTPEVASRLKGKVLLQLSTGTPKDARGGEAWARANGVDYLDGAIMGYPKDIGTNEGTILYSGPQEVYDTCSSLLLSLGGNPIFVGQHIGAASTLDCSILSSYYGTAFGFLHGAAICHSEGFSIEVYTATVLSLVSVLADTIKTCGEMITKGSYDGSQSSLSTHAAGFKHVLQLSRENGIDSRYTQLLADYFDQALATGHGQDELAALFEVLKSHPKSA
jgi:3-hydroxyisobutyrate dehydrogenase-like beta-hydroxyacid dehydrogenase